MTTHSIAPVSDTTRLALEMAILIGKIEQICYAAPKHADPSKAIQILGAIETFKASLTTTDARYVKAGAYTGRLAAEHDDERPGDPDGTQPVPDTAAGTPLGAGPGRTAQQRTCRAHGPGGVICTAPADHGGEHRAHGTESDEPLATWVVA